MIFAESLIQISSELGNIRGGSDAHIDIWLPNPIDRVSSCGEDPSVWHCHANVVDDPTKLLGHFGHVSGRKPAPGDGRIVVQQPHRCRPRGYITFANKFGPVRTILLKVVKSVPYLAADRSSRKMMTDA